MKTRAKAQLLRARDRKNAARNQWSKRCDEFQLACRDYLKAEGWIEESRYDGSMRWVRAYRRPTGTTWHTLNGALEAQKRRERKARKK
jgi:hypothetical protein